VNSNNNNNNSSSSSSSNNNNNNNNNNSIIYLTADSTATIANYIQQKKAINVQKYAYA
jgi:hypothetical protein